MVEHSAVNRRVVGSSPIVSATILKKGIKKMYCLITKDQAVKTDRICRPIIFVGNTGHYLSWLESSPHKRKVKCSNHL